jgi:hypothetical protein
MLMEMVKELLSDPDSLAAFGYGAALLSTSAYAAYKNDFGADAKTRKELESYVEENEPSLSDPVDTWRYMEYKKELEKRDINYSDGKHETAPETEHL